MRSFRGFAAVCFFLTWCIAPEVRAAGNIHIGSLEIHPYESITQTYNDNIFLEPAKQENSDQITESKIGLRITKPVVPGRDFLLNINYFADIIEYNNNTSQDRVDHTVNARGDFLFAGQLILRLVENFKKTANPPNSELADLEKRLRNINKAVLGYRGKKVSFEVSSQFIRDNYDTLNSLDKKEYITGNTVFFNVSPKTSFFAEYTSGKVRYDENTTNVDSEYRQWQGGVKGQLAPKLTGILKVGYKETDYDDARKTTDRDFAGVTTFTRFTYRLKQRSTVTIFGDRTSVESTFLTNNFFIRNHAGGSIDHQLTKKIFVLGEGSYQFNRYPEKVTFSGKTERREDNLRSGKGGFRYEFKEWLHISAEYLFREKDSNFDAFEYENNIYSGKLSLIF